MRDVFDILNKIKAPQVLDAATGRGEFIHILRQKLGHFQRIVGVDSDPQLVDTTQKLFPQSEVEIHKMYLEQLRFEDQYFDLISISNALHHLVDVDKVLSELMRVLKPGGFFLVSEMYQGGSQSEAQHTHILMHHWLAKADQHFETAHFETLYRDQILSKIQDLALGDLHVEDYIIPVHHPKDVKNCESLKRKFVTRLNSLDSLEDSEVLKVEGEMIHQRIQDIGCAPANRVLLLGTKTA